MVILPLYNKDVNNKLLTLRKGDVMKNIEIKMELLKQNMKQYELADLLGITEFSLSRKLRKELPKEEQEKIVKLIRERGNSDGQ